MWAAQTTFGERLQGHAHAFQPTLQLSLIQTLPWIPVTLAVIWMATRFPITRLHWRTRLPSHLIAALVLAFVANVLVTLGFWLQSRSFGSASALVKSGVLWASIRLQTSLLIYAAVAGVTQALAYYRDVRTRELQLARARLQTLNAQIRPHFLLNTLHTIGQLWRSGRNDEADEVLDHLGGLFRRVNRTTEQPEVTLAEEMEMVRDYLSIEQVRFRDHLRVDIDVCADTTDLLVPPLILQPLVENAIRHGKPRHLRVSAHVRDGKLVLAVSNDGVAFSNGDGKGTGLGNARERLLHLYGADASLNIQSQTDGTTVCITLPAHED